jgi:hypothetical protein
LRERLSLLTLSVRLFVAVLLVSVAYPGVAALYGALHGAAAGGVLAWSSQHLPIVWAGAAAAILVALLVLERPRAPSARAYTAQLRNRFRATQDEFERALEVAQLDRMSRESRAPGRGAPDSAAERLDGPEAADNTRR